MEIAGTEAAEKVCPQCAEAVKGAARVCRYCGHRFDGEPASSIERNSSRGLGILIWSGASVAFMVIGSFGPWIEALGQSVSGTDGSNDGWVVVAAAVIGALLMYVTRANRGAGIWAIVAGLAGSIVTIHDRSHASHAISNAGALVQAVARIGWGLNLAMVASISLVIAGVVWLVAIPSEPARGISAVTPDVKGQPDD